MPQNAARALQGQEEWRISAVHGNDAEHVGAPADGASLQVLTTLTPVKAALAVTDLISVCMIP